MKRPYVKPAIETVEMFASAIAAGCRCSGETEASAIANFVSNWGAG